MTSLDIIAANFPDVESTPARVERAHMLRQVDVLKADLRRVVSVVRLSQDCKPLVAAIRFLATSEKLTCKQIIERFGMTARWSRAAVISLCHRVKPRIEFTHDNNGWKVWNDRHARDKRAAAAATIEPINPNLSTHHARLRSKVEVNRKFPDDTSLRFACPNCGAAPGYKCTGEGMHGKRYTVRLHKARLELNRNDPSPPALATQPDSVPTLKPRIFVARCMWAGCGGKIEPGKPYCAKHHTQSGLAARWTSR